MEYTLLGNTGLRVSVLGLGTGGRRRLGLACGGTESGAIDIIRCALDQGITLFDTAEVYGNEAVLGKALSGRDRSNVVVSSKIAKSDEKGMRTEQGIEKALDATLAHLSMSEIDVYHVHGVVAEEYDAIKERFVPVLLRMKEKGKIRALGVTELFATDPGHAMLQRAVHDACWDVVMTGFNFVNQSARTRVLPGARKRAAGVLCMFAVRKVLASPEDLAALLVRLIDEGHIEGSLVDRRSPVESLFGTPVPSITDVAYRFCRWEPGIGTVLCGTSSTSHLIENVQSMEKPPLDRELTDKLTRVFGSISHVSCD